MKAEQITLALPFGLGSMTLTPNRAEQQAAWALYVELQTRIAVQAFDREMGCLRDVLSSLYTIHIFTREILREAGPDVAHGEAAFGPLAIRILTEGLGPFLTHWHQALLQHEAVRPEGMTTLAHERAWDQFETMIAELETLQGEMKTYASLLLTIARG